MAIDLGQFRELGYQVIPGIIPEALVREAHSFLAAQVDRMLEVLAPHGGTGGEITTALRSDPSLSQDIKVLMTGHFPLDVRLDAKLRNIPRNPDVRALLRAIHQTEGLKMHMPPMARFIMPGNAEAGVPPHQDASYNDHMDNFITMWVPLVPVDARCGGVTVYTGAPRHKIEVTRKVQNGVWMEGISTDDFVAHPCVPMRPGDVLIFDRYLVHGSMPNLSNRIRFSLDYRFFPATSPSSKHYLDMQTWEVCNPETAHV